MTADDDVKSLERRITILETQDAVRKERDHHIDQRFDILERMQRETQGTLQRLAWLVIGAVITAGLAVLLGGQFLAP